MMDGLGQSGTFTIPEKALSRIRERFCAERCDEERTAAIQARLMRSSGYLADPHTAVGLAGAQAHKGHAPMVTLSTAHPAKFPDATREATGTTPALPAWLGDLHERAERSTRLPADQKAVEAHILAHARATRETA